EPAMVAPLRHPDWARWLDDPEAVEAEDEDPVREPLNRIRRRIGIELVVHAFLHVVLARQEWEEPTRSIPREVTRWRVIHVRRPYLPLKRLATLEKVQGSELKRRVDRLRIEGARHRVVIPEEARALIQEIDRPVELHRAKARHVGRTRHDRSARAG